MRCVVLGKSLEEISFKWVLKGWKIGIGGKGKSNIGNGIE